MKAVTLPKGDLDLVASVFQQFGDVHAPVACDGVFAFRPIQRWSQATLDYVRTVLPPKKYLLPPDESLEPLRPKDAAATGTAPYPDAPRIVLFGVHACDIQGMNLLDLAFGGPRPDPRYRARRRNLIVIGADCLPDGHCFCPSMGAAWVDRGFDLFLHDIGDRYWVRVATPRGEAMVGAARGLFHPATEAHHAAARRREEGRWAAFARAVPAPADPALLFRRDPEPALWEELGERCLACGACGTVCPTCACNRVHRERPEPGSPRATVRRWSSCLYGPDTPTLTDGTRVARRAHRVAFRFLHKHHLFLAAHGVPACVGCGRCAVACPVGIHAREVLRRIQEVDHALR